MSQSNEVARWSPEYAAAHLAETFDQAARLDPDLMEPYATRLEGAGNEAERVGIMRAGLRETIGRRFVLKTPEGKS